MSEPHSVALERSLPRAAAWIAVLVCVGLIVGLRLIALRSDAYSRLSWSTALLTDEGFYIHNARNLNLFGHARTDDFNNMLLMPTLHVVQIAVFRVFGVGVVQARMISVGCSLLTLALLWWAVRRAFGLRPAVWATLFLGLDHVNLLYNRLALMDTPAALLLVGAFAAFVRAYPQPTPELAEPQEPSACWLAVCGALLGLAYATRGLSALLFPAFFFAPVLGRPAGRRLGIRRELGWLALGLAVVMAVYFAVWWLPNRAELARINRYYLTNQILPHSFRHLWQNIVHAFFGDTRGMSPYLCLHTPVQFALSIGFLIGYARRRARSALSPASSPFALLAALWMAFGWAAMAVLSYSPSRYYVLFYPAMAMAAALALENCAEIGAEIVRNRRLRAALGGFLTYHLAQIALRRTTHASDLPLTLIALVVALALVLGKTDLPPNPLPKGKGPMQRSPFPKTFAALSGKGAGGLGLVFLLLLWAGINLCWTGDWLTHLTYRQGNADRWLAANLPANSVLLGDVAPGLCLNNRFVAVSVIKGLCNDAKPVERFAPAPRFLVILDDRLKEPYWTHTYPQLTATQRRVHAFQQMLRPDMTVGVYRVP